MKTIRLRLSGRSYDIVIGSGLIGRLGVFLKDLKPGRRAVIVTNKRLRRIYGRRVESSIKNAGIAVSFVMIPDSEKAKSFKTAESALNRIAAFGASEDIFLVALGGGVTGDLTGFLAGIFKRGIPYIQVPTTLLAQVDSAIGGKTAVDLPAAKNLAGVFYQPGIVLSDIDTLKSLPRRQVVSAMSEIIKYGVISDRRLFEFLENDFKKVLKLERSPLEYVIGRSSAIKASFVERDEFDRKGRRALLNFGHTIGHAVEAASGYSSAYGHGEAVSIGMAAAAEIAFRLRMLTAEDTFRIIALLKECGLPVTIRGVSREKIFAALKHDKKFCRGANRFVLPLSIGRAVVVENVPERIIREVITGRMRG